MIRGRISLSVSLFSLFSLVYNSPLLDTDPCSTLKEVTDRSSIHYRGKDIDMPWLRNDVPSKIFESDELYEWMWLRAIKVKGLDGKSVEDVMGVLESINCTFIAWGDSVWKSIRRMHPTSIEGEVSCSMDKLEKECFSRFGWNGCSYIPSSNSSSSIPYIEIGRSDSESYMGLIEVDPIRIYPSRSKWNIPFNRLGFTVDSMAIYDNLGGKVYVIDMSGRGLRDACERELHSFVNKDDWNEWIEGNGDKILRYFELRSQDFRPAEEELRNVIESELLKLNESLSDESIRRWYCEYGILNGIEEYTSDGRYICYLEGPNPSPIVRKRAKSVTEAFILDAPSAWKKMISPLLESIEEAWISKNLYNERRYIDRPRMIDKEEEDRGVTSLDTNRIERGPIVIPDIENNDDNTPPLAFTSVPIEGLDYGDMEYSRSSTSYIISTSIIYLFIIINILV